MQASHLSLCFVVLTKVAKRSRCVGFEDGDAADAKFCNPFGLATDSTGNVIVADNANHRIRKITSSGQVTTIAGSGDASFADGISTSAGFNLPYGVVLDDDDNIIVADLRIIASAVLPQMGW